MFSSCEVTQKMYNFQAKLADVDWKSLKIKDVPIDVVRVVICLLVILIYLFTLPCLCSQSAWQL